MANAPEYVQNSPYWIFSVQCLTTSITASNLEIEGSSPSGDAFFFAHLCFLFTFALPFCFCWIFLFFSFARLSLECWAMHRTDCAGQSRRFCLSPNQCSAMRRRANSNASGCPSIRRPLVAARSRLSIDASPYSALVFFPRCDCGFSTCGHQLQSVEPELKEVACR